MKNRKIHYQEDLAAVLGVGDEPIDGRITVETHGDKHYNAVLVILEPAGAHPGMLIRLNRDHANQLSNALFRAGSELTRIETVDNK